MEYRKAIIKLIGKIDNESFLKRIYCLAEYLYLHKEDG